MESREVRAHQRDEIEHNPGKRTAEGIPGVCRNARKINGLRGLKYIARDIPNQHKRQYVQNRGNP